MFVNVNINGSAVAGFGGILMGILATAKPRNMKYLVILLVIVIVMGFSLTR